MLGTSFMTSLRLALVTLHCEHFNMFFGVFSTVYYGSYLQDNFFSQVVLLRQRLTYLNGLLDLFNMRYSVVCKGYFCDRLGEP